MTELLDTKAIADLLKISHRQARDRLVKSTTFPRPALALSQKIKRWSRQDVESWIERNRAMQAR